LTVYRRKLSAIVAVRRLATNDGKSYCSSVTNLQF